MANTIIQLKNSGTLGSVPSSLSPGEIAVNHADGKLYYGNSTSAAILFNTITEPSGLNGEIQFNSSGSFGAAANLSFNVLTSTLNTNSIVTTGGVTSSGSIVGSILESTQSSGDEGGQIDLALATTNQSLSGKIAIDVYQNKIRIFETGGTNRGVFIDMANGATGGVGTNLLSPPGGSVTLVAGVTGVVSNTQILSGIQSVDGSGSGLDADLLDGLNSSDFARVSSESYANSAYNQANTATNNAAGSSLYANGAFIQANSAYNQANSAYNQANTATNNAAGSSLYANGAFIQANSAFDTANVSFIQANAAFDKANSANVLAQAAFNTVNVSFIQANSAFNTANVSFIQANSAFIQANAAFDKANSANVLAQNAFNTANTKLNTTGGTISGDLSVTGNLTIIGNTTTINVSTLKVTDSIIQLAVDNQSDLLDIGFIGHYNNTPNNHTGLVRKYTDGVYYLFDSYTPGGEPTNTIDIANTRVATLSANIVSNVITLGGLNLLNYANIIFNTANAAFEKANVNPISPYFPTFPLGLVTEVVNTPLGEHIDGIIYDMRFVPDANLRIVDAGTI